MIGLSFGAAYGIEFVKSQPLLSTTSRYGMKGSVVTLNPLFIRPYTAEHAFSRLMFKGLFTYDSGGMITGDLASSWEFIEEGKVLEVSLAEGLEWSDGTPITAQDVAFTYSIVQNDEYVGWADGFFNKVEIIASEDGSSVTFRLPSAYVPILDTLTLPVLPEHVFAEKNLIEVFDQRFLNDPVTSNEYRLTSYLQTPPTSDQQWQELTFKSSTENQEFQVRLYPTLEQISSAFTFGELDGFLLSDWWGVDAMLETISIGPKDVSLTGHYYSLIFNTEREISLEDRKALSSNLDRGQIPGLAASGPIPSNSPYWTEHAELRVGFDHAAQGTL